MPRWENGSKDRLQKAALELFHKQGFENTSVNEIAERARVTTRTFFRHFADKREVLFAGADDLRAALVDKILRAPDLANPLQAVTGVLVEFDWESLESRDSQRRRQAIIAANPELLERDLIKQHNITMGLMNALQRRGVDTETAQLAARVGGQMFLTAYERWLRANNRADLAEINESVTSLLKTIVSSATPSPPSRKKGSTRSSSRKRLHKR